MIGSAGASPWNNLDYQRIVSAQWRDGRLRVDFADGTTAVLLPTLLVPAGPVGADWSRVRAEEFHVVVPTPDGDMEVPWDVIRIHSDPAFDAYWAGLVGEPADAPTPASPESNR